MSFYYLMILAIVLDLLLGEPPNAWHPVAWFGRCAMQIEKSFRKIFGNGVFSGSAAWLLMTVVPAATVFLLVRYGLRISSYCGWTIAILSGYFCIALRSLLDHSRRIRKPLTNGDLPEARRALAMIVSRETASLPESEIVRGGVESIGENLIDAVTSALFWMAVGYWCGGLPGAAAGAVFLRCVNTLDACWGYRDERYLKFGRTAAKTDDWIHFIPARLTLPAIALAALLTGGSFTQTLKTGWKHRKDHPSPNSCFGMAGFAGALKIRLGGPTLYPDGMEKYPWWGDGRAELDRHDLLRAEILAVASALIFTLFLCAVNALIRWGMLHGTMS